jgi:hypothetical protein
MYFVFLDNVCKNIHVTATKKWSLAWDLETKKTDFNENET